jgi:hypothetical protein
MLSDYFPPHQHSRKEVEDRIQMFERAAEQLRKELERRKSPNDEFKYGVPIQFLNEEGKVQNGWKVFDSQSEAFNNAGKYLPDLVRGDDDYEARYKVEKVYI